LPTVIGIDSAAALPSCGPANDGEIIGNFECRHVEGTGWVWYYIG